MNIEQKTPAPEQKTNLVQPKREFGLESSPDAYIISVHIRNMMATMGEEYVRAIITELFLTTSKPQKQQTTATGDKL